MQLLQNYYASRVGGQQQQPPPQQAGAPGGMPQQATQQFGMGGPQAAPGNIDQTKLAAVVATLTPEARAQLAAMPADQQRTVLMQLYQRHQLQEQQQQQRMMLQQQQAAAAGAARGGMMGGMVPQGGPGMQPGMGGPGMGAPGGMVPQGQGGMARGSQPGGRPGEDPLQDVNWFLNDS